MAFFTSAQPRGSFFDPRPSFVVSVRDALGRRRRIGQVRRQLSGLSDRDLADIGIARTEIDAIARQAIDRG